MDAQYDFPHGYVCGFTTNGYQMRGDPWAEERYGW
jgi:hypothetical protein